MEFFTSFRSKKTSEAGVWISDVDVENCGCCGVKFALMVRKHHCRQCGGIVCGVCSENRKFLESSRSGAPKRVCDKCFASGDRSVGGADSGSAAGQAAADGDDDDDAAEAVGRVRLEGDGAAYPRRTAQARLPDIAAAEAVEALASHPFEGRWQAILHFTVVDMVASRVAEARGEAADKLAAFKSIAVAGGKSTLNRDGTVKAGSKVRVFLELEPKGAAYFRGTCPEFGQFGVDGKVTGAIQRASGKINMTIQMVANKVTTSFNFVGLMDRGGVFAGNFSGCEISRQAGSVSGSFKIVRTTGEAGATSSSSSAAAAAAASDEEYEAERERKRAAGAKGKAAAARKIVDSDSEEDDSSDGGGRKGAAAKKAPAAKKGSAKAAAGGSSSEDSEDSGDAGKRGKKAPAPKGKTTKKPSSDSDSGSD